MRFSLLTSHFLLVAGGRWSQRWSSRSVDRSGMQWSGLHTASYAAAGDAGPPAASADDWPCQASTVLLTTISAWRRWGDAISCSCIAQPQRRYVDTPINQVAIPLPGSVESGRSRCSTASPRRRDGEQSLYDRQRRDAGRMALGVSPTGERVRHAAVAEYVRYDDARVQRGSGRSADRTPYPGTTTARAV